MPKPRLIVRKRTDKSFELGFIYYTNPPSENYFHKFYKEAELDEHVKNFRAATKWDLELENTIDKEPDSEPMIKNPSDHQPWKDMQVNEMKVVKGNDALKPYTDSGTFIQKKEKKSW